MRITQQMMYSNMVSNMNRSLSDYMDSNIQSATQKRVNRPSDDPVGMTRILQYRASIEQNKTYEYNSQDAASWLASTDTALTKAQTLLNEIRVKAEQASTGSVTAENRYQIGMEVRQMFGQLMNITNTEFAGQQLFAGTRYDQSAYQEGLGITTKDPNLQTALRADGTTQAIPWEVQGGAQRTIMVRFDLGAGNTAQIGGAAAVNYSYSKDGGATWVNATLPAGSDTIDLDGASIKFPTTAGAPADPSALAANLTVVGYDPDKPTGYENGTMLFVRPTAYYQGDTNDIAPSIPVDTHNLNNIANAKAAGIFKSDVQIRMDSAADVTVDGKVSYSYSSDHGITWQQGTADTHAGGTSLRLNLPTGYVDITPVAGQPLNATDQFVVRPRRADLNLEIAQDEFMSVTNCGKDIFGGQYTKDFQNRATPAEVAPENVFEVISDFIAWAETGPQSGCQDVLARLGKCMEGMVTNIAKVGGKINRVETNLTILQSNRDDKKDRISKIEDVDLTELIARLSQQQTAYQSVLQSSSMIMQLNLTKFL